MRLGYDLSILRHPYGGTARYAVELHKAMQGACPNGDQIVVDRAWPRLSRGRRLGRYLNLGLDLGWLGVGVPFTVLRHGIDVWYSPSNSVPATVGRPALVTIHDINFLLAPDAYDRRYAKYAELMTRRSLRRAWHIVTDSQFSRSQIIEAFAIDPGRISVIYPGIDHISVAMTNKPERPDKSPVPYCLFVGQTEPHKNVGLLFEAWRGSVPLAMNLVIVGPPGRADEELRSQAARPPLRGRVHFLGRVSNQRLDELYRAALCLLLPSKAEGFGFPALEAMAHGLPVAVARAGSLPEITRGAAELFDPNSPEEVAAVVSRLAGDPQARAALATRGREVAGSYRWSATAEAVWRLAAAAYGASSASGAER